MFKKLLLFSCLALSMVTARAAYVPVVVTGYNSDVVAEGINAPTVTTTVDVDGTGSGYVFITPNFQNTSTATLPTKFLPATGAFTSAATAGLGYQLASYTGNNALQLTLTRLTDSLVFSTPQAFGELAFLSTSGNGASSIDVTVNFMDGTSQAPTTFAVLDWFQNTPPANIAIANIGRAGRGNGTLDGMTSTTGPNLYESKITILAANQAKLIRSVKFVRTTTTAGVPHIMGITGSTVCVAPPIAGTVISSAGSSVCSGVNFTLSLSGSNAGIGSTYQWQSSSTGTAPWTNVASATSATLTTSQTTTNSYRAFTVCNGTAADTSAAITLTMKAANQCYCIPTATSALYYISNFTTTGGVVNVNNSTAAGTTSLGYSDFTGQTISGIQTSTINFASTFANNTFGAKIYADWNQNGTFDASEQLFVTTGYVSSITGSFVVPTTALPGLTRLRVIADEASNTAAFAPCGYNGGNYGEAEDYSFNVIASNCYAPTALAVTPITATGATFTWSAPTATTPSNYQWVIIAGSNPVTSTPVASGTVASTVFTVSPNTLASSTAYTFYLRSKCSGTDTSIWISIPFTTICGGTPSAGTAASSVTSACTSVGFNLSSTGATAGPGITYQWQVATASAAGPFTDIASATNATYTANQSVASWYRLKVRCNTSDSSLTNIVAVAMTAPLQCYCTPVANGNTYYIANFTTTGATTNVANVSTFGTTSVGYSNFLSQVVKAQQGSTVNFSMSHGSSASSTFGTKIYIDWNQNGVFTDAGETMFASTGYATTFAGSFTVPASATPGSTRMRVMSDFNNSAGPTTPCGFASNNGEAEDYTFTITTSAPCAAPTTQPTALALTSGVTSITGNFSASVPAADEYLVLRTLGTTTPTTAPVNGTSYSVGSTLGNAVVVNSGNNAITFTDVTVAPNTQYRYTIYGYNEFCLGSITYNISTPLTGTITTAAASVYTWNGNVSTDWQIAANWTPTRTTPAATDVLQFNNGLTNNVTNVPTQTIGRLSFTNTTTATLKAQTAAARTLTMTSDNLATTNELDIAAGSGIILNDTVTALAFKFAGTGGTSRIAGTLEVNNGNAIVNTIDFTNTIDTVTTTGTLAAGGTVNTSAFTSTATNLIVNGTYNHKYTTVGGGNIPTATWGSASNVLISGYTTATGGPAGGLGQVFNNFTYNAPLQTANSQWSGSLPGTINGTLAVQSTGTGQWLWATTTTYTLVTNNFVQSGGTVDLGTSTGAKTVLVSGVFNQSGGILKATGAGAVTFNYNGTVSPQSVSFYDSSVTGPIVYRVSNPYGIVLAGTGALAISGQFRINSGGGVQITTTIPNPISSNLALNYFATGTTLTYDGAAPQAITSTIWPAVNGPLNVTINNTGGAANNQVTLPGSRSLAATGVLTMSNGVLVLGSNNLTLTNTATGAISIATPSATKMIAADGSGQLIRGIATAATTYLFPVGDQTSTVEYSPVSLSTTSTGTRLMGVRVVNAHNPNDASATYLNRYWVFTDTATSAYTYNGNFTYTTADVVGTEANLRLSEWNGTAWAQIPSLPNAGVLTIQGTQSSAFLPLGGMQLTGRIVIPGNIYTWNASNTDYQVPTSWTPARNVPDPADILQFNNGIIDTVKNIPTQTITRMTFTNNTTAVFAVAAANTLTFLSDNVTTTDELSIAAGSTLSINGTAASNIAFSGTGGTANIAGTLDVVNIGSTVNPSVNFTNAIATVASTGMIASGSATSSGANNYVSTAANLIMNGTYNHKFTVNSGGGIPVATWNPSSTVLISGYTTSTGGPNGNLGQTFANFTYNCPNQTAVGLSQWSGPNPLNITGTLSIVSTGAGAWYYSSNSAFVLNVGSFVQTGGLFDLSSGNGNVSQVMNVSGTFNKTGGTFKASNNSGQPNIVFNGTAVQNVTFDSSANGRFLYWITNPAGINLIGSGALTSFKINDGGGIRISSTAANPINTTLALTYAATGTTLTYDPAGSVTATASVWPATAGPLNVTVNTGNSSNVLTVPFSRTVGGTLNMTSGDINISSNTLTLGTTAAAAGTLTYGAGNIRVTTGVFNRFYGTTGLPTATGTGVGFYPIANANGANRNVALYFSAAAALGTGGAIGVGHTDVTGIATITPVLDGTYSIDRRTNASWNFTQSGIALATTNTIGVRVTGTGLLTSTTPANLRVMQPAAVVGTHVPGAGVSAQRAGLVVADLASPYHIGANATDITGAYIATTTGNWSAPATWLGGLVPAVTNDAFINPGVTVTADAATNTAKALTILPGGILTINSNTVTIDSAILNNGTVNIGGGTLLVNGATGASGINNAAGSTFNVSAGTATVGPTGGSNKPFITNGTLTVSGGTLNINGYMLNNAGSTFNQTGGNINVDGNAASVAANSVPSGTAIVSWRSQLLNLTGGNFTIVDPHPNSTATNTFEYNNSTAHVNLPATHTFILGNGTSTDTSANTTYGFRLNTFPGSNRISFGKMIVNGGVGANRYVTNTFSFGINGDLVINTGGEVRLNTTIYLNGNLTVNAGGTYTSNGSTTVFASFLNGTQAGATAAQTVSGAGTFRNSTNAAPAANFNSVTVQNANNVTFNTGTDIAFSGTTTFTAATTPSHIIMSGTNRYIEISGASLSGNGTTGGWLVGRYQKTAGSVGGFSGTLPVGDLNYYTPITFVTATTTAAGAIWGSTTPLDHPNIATSAITAGKSVNRYYTITPVNGVAFTPTSTVTFGWNAADVDAGANTAIFTVGKYAGSTWTYSTVASATATTINGTSIDLNTAGDYEVGEPCSPLNITTQPANVAACVGGPVTLSIGVNPNANVNYQWQKGTTNITGATGATYTIPAVTAADAGTYRVVLTSNCAAVTSVTSANATLTINAPAAITTQPATQAICPGNPATVSVVATGTALTYQWKKNGVDIAGANAASYTIPTVGTADTASYTVLITGAAPCGFVTSAPAVISLKELPLTITAAGPLTFCPGGSVTLNGPATTPTNTLTYVWNVGGSPITPAQTNRAFAVTTSGSYTATITNTANGCSNTSNAIVVAVNGAPQSTIIPAGTASFCAGSSIVLHGLSTPGLTYEWYLNGNTATVLGTDSTYTATVGGSYTAKVSIGTGCSTISTPTVVTVNPLPTITTTPTGAQAICQNDTLLLTAFYTNATVVWKFNGNPVTPAATGPTYKAFNSGTYTVTATATGTGCQSTSAPVNLTLNALPTITAVSANASTFCAGGADTLKATPVTGLTYVWNRGGTPIAPAANGANYVALISGSYTVTGTNSNGCKATSAPIAVTVNPLPGVVVTPSLPLAICSGQTNNLCVPTATGLTYQWSDANGTITGATSACYAATIAGAYSVKVTNTATGCSATSAVSTIIVNPIPASVITLPASTTACTGDTVCLNANTGANLSYQWRLNTNAIVGATGATYCATTSGIYSVTVTNGSNCSINSNAVIMTFNPRPTATISYTTPVTFCEGGAVVLTGVSNTGTSYQWQNNGAALTGATSSNYIASNTGSYSVVITNGFGCSTVSPTILVVSNPLPQPVVTRTGNILSTGSYATYQWYVNSQPINGATNQSVNATQNGGYAVRVIDFNGCVNYSSVMFLNNVGIGGNPAVAAAAVKVFPNPVHNVVNIEAPAQVNVILRDLMGRMVKQVDNVKQLDMSGLPDGYYMLMISDKNGLMIKAEKVMKVAE